MKWGKRNRLGSTITTFSSRKRWRIPKRQSPSFKAGTSRKQLFYLLIV
jgi:hypothetical protein